MNGKARRATTIRAAGLLAAQPLAWGLPVMAADSAPSPTTAEPLELERSVVVELDGVRLSMTIDGSPPVAGERAWITTTLTNSGGRDLIWQHGRCDSAVLVKGIMDHATWRSGAPATPGDIHDLK